MSVFINPLKAFIKLTALKSPNQASLDLFICEVCFIEFVLIFSLQGELLTN